MMSFYLLLSFLLANVCALRVNPVEKTEKTELVIVRTVHNITPGTLQRIYTWAQDLKENLPSVHLLVSIDETNQSGKATLDLPEKNIHHYTWQNVLDTYPVLNTADADLYAAAKLGHSFNPLWPRWPHPELAALRYYHAEPVLLAWEHAKRNANVAKDAKVWAFESDVFLCGNLSSLLKAYKDVDADFLGNGEPTLTHPYALYQAGNEQWRTKYKLRSRYVEHEFVQRYSPKFLEMVHHSSQEYSAVSEMYLPTLCKNEPESCKYGEFDQKHRGSIKWNKHNTPESVAKECSRQQNETTINHAAKYNIDVPEEALSPEPLTTINHAAKYHVEVPEEALM